MSEQRKAVIKNADMSDQMQQDAVDIASKALSEYSIEKVWLSVVDSKVFDHSLFLIWNNILIQDVAAYIKKEFDRKHGPTWYVLGDVKRYNIQL